MKKYIKHLAVLIAIVVGLAGFLAFKWSPGQSDGSIVVNCNMSPLSSRSMIGFLHSFNDTYPAQKLIDDVAPKTWRLGGNHLSANYRNSSLKSIRGRSITPILVFSDYYSSQKDGIDQLFPISAHLARYKELVAQAYGKYGNNAIYDIWNEPNHPSYWKGSEADFFNAFKVAHDVIRSLPGGDQALISGPSTAGLDKEYIQRFLTFCVNNNIKLDILSWHDFRNGDKLMQLKSDIQWAKDNWMKKYPSLGIKKVQLNEIIGPKDQYSPLVPLMYFNALEQSGADAACKGCWPNSKGVSNCNNNSLDGLINEAGQPRSIWWSYKYYNESTKGRLTSSSSSQDLIPFAYEAPDSSNEIRILLANYKNDLGAVNVSLRQLRTVPAFTAKNSIVVELYQIPDTEEDALSGPKLVSTKTVSIGSAASPSFSIPDLASNQVYLVKIK